MPADAVAQLTPQESVIYLMVMASASDGRITERELRTIGRVVRSFPLFSDADEERLVETADADVLVPRRVSRTQTAEACGALMSSSDGLHRVLEAAKRGLPRHLAETAYAAVVDVVSADESIAMTEIRVLELVRNTLAVSNDGASAIERAAKARHMTLDDAE